VNKILVFRTFLSENCYTLFLTMVLFLQDRIIIIQRLRHLKGF